MNWVVIMVCRRDGFSGRRGWYRIGSSKCPDELIWHCLRVDDVNGYLQANILALKERRIRGLSTRRRLAYLPIPIPNLTSTLHLISKRLSVTLDWPPSSLSSPSSMPPRTPLACFGTSKTKFATPSAPGGMMYSGPLNGTVVNVSES